MDAEAELMLRTAGGDERAFAEIVARTKRRVFGIIYRVVGRAREAEDLAQEAYLRVWQARGRYRPEARFSTWLYTIVTRLCLNEREKLARRGAPPVTEEAVDVPDPAVRREESVAVRAAMLSLPESQRMAVALRYFGELEDREVAEAMGASLSAIQSLLFRGRQKLLESLERASMTPLGG